MFMIDSAVSAGAETTTSWQAFELSVLRRLKFASVLIPFCDEPTSEISLQRWGAHVFTNHTYEWSRAKTVAALAGHTAPLTEEDVESVLADAYVPGHEMHNPSLAGWFAEPDAWWFDNVRWNIEQIEDRTKRRVALRLGIETGDYARSFDKETRELRQPLTNIYRKLWRTMQHGKAIQSDKNAPQYECAKRPAREFIAERHADLLFLRSPDFGDSFKQASDFRHAWRESWVRGGVPEENDTIKPLSESGKQVASKRQYLRNVEELLETALHVPRWAVCHTESGFLSIEEMVETVSRVRPVETVYTKDFSELMFARTAIIVA